MGNSKESYKWISMRKYEIKKYSHECFRNNFYINWHSSKEFQKINIGTYYDSARINKFMESKLPVLCLRYNYDIFRNFINDAAAHIRIV